MGVTPWLSIVFHAQAKVLVLTQAQPLGRATVVVAPGNKPGGGGSVDISPFPPPLSQTAAAFELQLMMLQLAAMS